MRFELKIDVSGEVSVGKLSREKWMVDATEANGGIKGVPMSHTISKKPTVLATRVDEAILLFYFLFQTVKR